MLGISFLPLKYSSNCFWAASLVTVKGTTRSGLTPPSMRSGRIVGLPQ